MIFSGGIIRTSITSIKYATMSQEKLRTYFERYLSNEEINSELTVDHWTKQDESSVNAELIRLLKQQTEELSFFKINFINEINDDLEQQLKSN